MRHNLGFIPGKHFCHILNFHVYFSGFKKTFYRSHSQDGRGFENKLSVGSEDDELGLKKLGKILELNCILFVEGKVQRIEPHWAVATVLQD